MFLIVRAVVYAALFISLFYVWVPRRLLSTSGIEFPPTIGATQVAGALLAAIGAALAVWCILMFVFVGRGTPAPFDPPRRLVIGGPYRFVRNPMYIGGGTALLGGALFYQSFALLLYAAVFFLLAHLIVIGYEEPALRRRFPHQYPVYCTKAERWLAPSSARRFSAVS